MKKSKILILSRRDIITPRLVNKVVKIPNGKTFQEILVTEAMVGFKAGSFSLTRSWFYFKQKVKK